MLRPVLCLLVACAFVPSSQAQAVKAPQGVTAVTAVEGIEEYRLPNGLQVLLVPDSSKPTTTVNMTVRVGSRFENYGETGMAHLLEHMMFKGTPKHPKVWSEFEKRGLRANGSTSFDRTNYTASFSANEENLNWYLGWLSDALVNSYVARKDLDTEMTVVRNEMEMGENSPESTLYKKTLAVMYDWHNYGKDTIGARADVENVDIPRLQAFYHLYYQPDNTTLVVSGRFDKAKVLAQVRGTFGRTPAPKRKLPTFYTLDPAQDGERSLHLRRVGGVPIVFAGYHVPAAADPDFAAVDVLGIVMGDTPSGRLHKRLTEKQLAAGTFAFTQGMHDPGFAIFGAQLAPGQDAAKAGNELVAALESPEPITAEEVDRAKLKWAKGWEQTFTNPEAVGLALSESIAQGDWRLFFLSRDRVKAVTLADVQKAANDWLVTSNRTLATYEPTAQPVRAPEPRRVDAASQLKDFKPQQAAAAVDAFEATPENIDRLTQRFQVAGIQAAVLPKGTRGQAVIATLTLRFGDLRTLTGVGDVPDFTAALLDKGTATMTREQLQDAFDKLQTEFAVGGGNGTVTVRLQSRRDTLPAALKLVAQMLRTPSFPADALDEVKRNALAGIEQGRKQPEALADNALSRLGDPYPKGDPRHAETFDEMVADVNAVTLEQVKAFHQRFYGARKGEFSAVGDFDPKAVQQALQEGLGDWNAGEAFTRIPNPITPVPATRLVIEAKDNQNATMLVKLAVPLSDADPDYAALTMANYLLGSGGNSRLWKRIREGEGLSYDVRSGVNWSNTEPHSEWQASAIFAPQNLAKVETAFKQEVDRALKDGFTQQELAEGQRGLLNYRRLGRAQDGSIAATLSTNEYLGRTMAISAKVDAQIALLTVEQVNAALRKYVKPGEWASAVAGDFKPAR